MAGALALAAAAAPTTGVSILGASTAAVGMSYGLGNMVAAFSRDKELSKSMLKYPDNLGSALGRTVLDEEDDDLGSATEDLIGAGMLFSEPPWTKQWKILDTILRLLEPFQTWCNETDSIPDEDILRDYPWPWPVEE